MDSTIPQNAPFKQGFLEFFMDENWFSPKKRREELAAYLKFIGITIDADQIEAVVNKGQHTLDQILKKTHDLFKYFTGLQLKIDTEQPFKGCIKVFYFFLLMESSFWGIFRQCVFRLKR